MDKVESGDTGVATETLSDPSLDSIDIDKVSDQIGDSIFGKPEEEEGEVIKPEEGESKVEKPEGEKQVPLAPKVEGQPPQIPQAIQPPKAWAKDTHEMFGKLPPEAQQQILKRETQILEGIEMYKGDAQFGRGIKEVTAPYEPYIASRGVDAPTAIKFLLNADYKLMHAQIPERTNFFFELAKDYGIDLEQFAGLATSANDEKRSIDPEVAGLKKQVSDLTNAMTVQQERELSVARAGVSKEIDNFATAMGADGKTPLHPYFDEVAEQIVIFINAGAVSLQDAYDKAVYSNPVTRQKELDRVKTDTETKLKERQRLDALKARKATSANVKGAETTGSPTEKLGSLEETIRSTYRDIKTRS